MTRLIKVALYVVFVILKEKQFVTFWQFVPAYQIKREKMLEDMRVICSSSVHFKLEDILDENNPETLTQFILDPTSFNLEKRVHISDPMAQDLFKISRDMCNHIHMERMKLLKDLSKKKPEP